MLQNLPKTGGFSNDLAVLKVNCRGNSGQRGHMHTDAVQLTHTAITRHK